MQTIEITGYTSDSDVIGKRVQFRTYEGETLIGTVTELRGIQPVITFDDGRWAYGTSLLTIAN